MICVPIYYIIVKCLCQSSLCINCQFVKCLLSVCTLLLSVCAKAVCASTVNLLMFVKCSCIIVKCLCINCQFDTAILNEWKQQFDTTIWHNIIEWKQQFDTANWYCNLESNWLQNMQEMAWLQNSLYVLKELAAKFTKPACITSSLHNLPNLHSFCINYQTSSSLFIHHYIITHLFIHHTSLHIKVATPSTLNSNAHQICIITKLPSKAKNQQIWV